MVRSIDVKLLTENIKEMCIQANHYLAPDMDKAMKNAYEKRDKAFGKADFGAAFGKSGYCRRRYDTNLSGYGYGSGVFKGRTGCTL